MSKVDKSELVDIFQEEVSKKKKKDLKKKQKLEKRMEKQEDLEFEIPNDSENTFLYDILTHFFLILFLLCSLGYAVFLLYTNFNKNTIIQCSLLTLFSLFYLLVPPSLEAVPSF